MLACDEGNIEMVDLLLQYSADPNLQQPVSKIEVTWLFAVKHLQYFVLLTVSETTCIIVIRSLIVYLQTTHKSLLHNCKFVMSK